MKNETHLPVKNQSVLIVGAGVSGIQAALDLAETNAHVYLVEKSPASGGRLPQLDVQFPTNDCGMCKLLPNTADLSEVCLKRGIFHPNIEFLPNAEVDEFTGSPGDFKVVLSLGNQYVSQSECVRCGKCINACPVAVRDEFAGNLTDRRAIYVRCPTSLPQVYAIDMDHCTKCGECVRVCPTSAIDLERKNIARTLDVGAVILAPGFEEFDPGPLEEFGYGRFPNVMTSTQLERALSGSGPFWGAFARRSDNAIPKKVAFLQCIGSRDRDRDYCSTACCMYAIKEANLLKDMHPDTEIKIFFMDLRAYGKDYYRYALAAAQKGIEFIRCRVPALEEKPVTGNLKAEYENEGGELVKEEFNLAVLSVGQCPPADAVRLTRVFGIELNKSGFALTAPGMQVETNKPGIYVCGSFREPASIQEAVVQASAAANHASSWLSPDAPPAGIQVRAQVQPDRLGVIICECGTEIKDTINTDIVLEHARQLTGVAVAQNVSYLCLPDGLAKLRKLIPEAGLTHLVIGACAPYRYEPLFMSLGREFGIPSERIEIADLRESAAWVHQDRDLAVVKAKAIISLACEKIRHQEALPHPRFHPVGKVLVIGGGASGMTASLSLASRGHDVDLIERTSELGGNMARLRGSLGGSAAQELLAGLKQKVEDNAMIRVLRNTEVAKIEGNAGNFFAEFAAAGQSQAEAGTGRYAAVVIATGADEYKPTEYSYGADPRIMTQRELTERLFDHSTIQPFKGSSVVMIQCVGSLNDEHPYCSRVCCSRAIENALRLKELNPKTNIYILYREIMTYGFKEELYTRAREAGVLFVRYDQSSPPQVAVNQADLEVQVKDLVLNETLLINPDLVVLSTGIVPNDNRSIALTLGLPLTSDGFFEESNIKYRPLEFHVPGIFVCGLAHSPMFHEEAITQAHAVCEKVVVALSRRIRSLRRTIAEVKERWCAACGLCVTACPFSARVIDEERNVAVVNEAFCQGCGECAVICPNKASKLRGARDKQMINMIEAALYNGGK